MLAELCEGFGRWMRGCWRSHSVNVAVRIGVSMSTRVGVFFGCRRPAWPNLHTRLPVWAVAQLRDPERIICVL